MFEGVSTPARFDIGRVFSRTFGVLGRNIGVCLVLAVVLIAIPTLVLSLLENLLPPSTNPFGTFFRSSLFQSPVSLITYPLLVAAMTVGVDKDLDGQRMSLGESLSVGFNRLLPMIGVRFCSNLITGLATFVLIVPGVILALCFAVALPVCVVEKRGIQNCFERSLSLTRDNRLMIFVTGLLMVLILIITILITAFLAGVVIGLTFAMAGAGSLAPAAGEVMGEVLANVAIYTLSATAIATIYFELRAIKEGGGSAQVARVFA